MKSPTLKMKTDDLPRNISVMRVKDHEYFAVSMTINGKKYKKTFKLLPMALAYRDCLKDGIDPMPIKHLPPCIVTMD